MVLSTEAGFGLEERNEGHMLISMDHYAPHFITHVVFAQPGTVAKNPALVARFLKSFFQAIAFMKANRAETDAIAERVLHQPASVVAKDYDFELMMFSDDGSFDPQAVAVLKQSFVDMGTLPDKPGDDKLFTTQFVPGEAQQAGRSVSDLLLPLTISIASGGTASSTAMRPVEPMPAALIIGPVASATSTLMPAAQVSLKPSARPRVAVT